jgi:translation initiation factor IF-3
VEIAANADPPVVKVIDMGKFLFEQTKKDRQARKAQTKIEVKEIRLRPKTNVHHRGFKVEDARRWLEHGMKVRVTIKFRGREITYPEIALEDLKEIAEALKDVSKIEASPSMEGKSMTLVLAPDKPTAKKPEAASPEKPAVQTEKPEAALKAEKSETPAKPEKVAVKAEKVEPTAKPEKSAAKAEAPAKTEKAAKTIKAE